MRFQLALLVLAALGCASCLALGLLLRLPGPEFDPLKAHAPCVQQVAGPTERWLCSDQPAYDLWDGRWHDGGRLTPAPSALPAR